MEFEKELSEKYKKSIKMIFIIFAILIISLIPGFFIEEILLKDDTAYRQLFWVIYIALILAPSYILVIIVALRITVLSFGSTTFIVYIDTNEIKKTLQREGFIEKSGYYFKRVFLYMYVRLEIIEEGGIRFLKISQTITESLIPFKIFKPSFTPYYNHEVYNYTTELLDKFPLGSLEERDN